MDLLAYDERFDDKVLYQTDHFLVKKPNDKNEIHFVKLVDSPDIEAVWVSFGVTTRKEIDEFFEEYLSDKEKSEHMGLMIESLVDHMGMAEFQPGGEDPYDIYRKYDVEELLEDFLKS